MSAANPDRMSTWSIDGGSACHVGRAPAEADASRGDDGRQRGNEQPAAQYIDGPVHAEVDAGQSDPGGPAQREDRHRRADRPRRPPQDDGDDHDDHRRTTATTTTTATAAEVVVCPDG